MALAESGTWAGKASRLAAVIAVIAVIAAFACGDADRKTTDIAYSYFDGPGVGVKIELSGVVVEMDSSVHFKSNFYSKTDSPTVRTQTINGMPFELVGGGFTLGENAFDGLEPGDRVLITAEGILVNGEKRWDLPTH